MATFHTNFSEYSVGSAQNDWTEYWHTGNFSLEILDTVVLGTNKITFAGPATADTTLAGLSVTMK